MVTTWLKLDLYNGFLNYQILILCPQDARNQILGLRELEKKEKKKKKSQSTLHFHNSHLLGIKNKGAQHNFVSKDHKNVSWKDVF